MKIEHPSIVDRWTPPKRDTDRLVKSFMFMTTSLGHESSSIQTYLKFVPDSPTSVLGWLTCSAKVAKVNVDKWTFSLTWSLFVLIFNLYTWRYLEWTAKDLSQSWPDQDALHRSRECRVTWLTDLLNKVGRLNRRIPPELWVIPISRKIILGKRIHSIDSFYIGFSGQAVPTQFVHRWMRYCDCE